MSITFIRTNSELVSCVSALQQCDELGLDLEFDKNLYHYGFSLCLVQIYDGENCWLIDPISEKLDIERLFPILEDHGIEKIVFAFGEDMRLLHSLGCFPCNIYDIDIATSLLNYPQGSLSKHLKDALGIEAVQSSQQSNWFTRPLTDEQVEYAAEDVRHLIRLKHHLEQEAEQKNISGWIAEENRAFDHQNYAEDASQTAVDDKEKKHFSEYHWHIYKNLMELREELAQNHNKPSFKLIPKDYLADVAREPSKLNQWKNRRAIHRLINNTKTRETFERVLKKSVIKAREDGLSQTDSARHSLSDEEYQAMKAERQKVNRLKSKYFGPIKKRIAEDYGQEAASFILSNRIIAELITDENHRLEDYKRKLIARYAEELNLDKEVIWNAVQ